MTCSRPHCEAEDTITVMGDDSILGDFCSIPHLLEWAVEMTAAIEYLTSRCSD